MDYLAKKVLKDLASKTPDVDRTEKTELVASHQRLVKSIGEFVDEMKKARSAPKQNHPPPPQVHVPEPTVIVEPGKPDTVMHEKLGELATVNRDMSRSLDSMLKILSDRDTQLQIDVTERDKKGNIKTFEIRRGTD